MSLTPEHIRDILKNTVDPETGISPVTAGALKNIAVAGNDVSLDIELGYPVQSRLDALREHFAQALTAGGAGKVELKLTWNVIAHAVQSGMKVMPQVRNVIAVA